MRLKFPVISHRDGPREQYDAVVIGAGIGGLISANLIAQSGLRTLLIDQHYVVGGYCSTFKRRGFVFDSASHFYPLLGDKTSLTGKLLDQIGSRTKWVKMDPVDRFHLPDGQTFTVSADFDTYMKDLKKHFPNQSDAIDSYFALVRKVYLWGVLYYFRGKYTSRLDPYLNMTLRDALNRFFTDERLKLVLTADVAHWGSPPSRTSFVFDSMLRLSYFLGNYYPVGGSQAFADDLAARFCEAGGQVLLKSSVHKILVENGEATGVELAIGPKRDRRCVQVSATTVVSNADMRLTVERLVGIQHFEPDYVQRLRKLRPTFACSLTHIGVRGLSRDRLEQMHGYYWRDWNSDGLTEGDFDFKVFVPTLYEPAMASDDGDVVIIQKISRATFTQSTDWEAEKQSTEQFVMQRLELICPGFASHAEVCLSATAITSQRFTNNYQGSMLGWEMSPDQLGEHRPAIESPIGRLFFVGQWTRPGGGITPVIVSAEQASKLAIAAILDKRSANKKRPAAHSSLKGVVGGKPVASGQQSTAGVTHAAEELP